MTHADDGDMYLVPADPPGTENRRWRCMKCGKLDLLNALLVAQCSRAKAPPSRVAGPRRSRNGNN